MATREPASSLTDVLGPLAEVMVGDYACFAGHLAAPDDPRPSVAADRLLTPQMRDAIAARFAARFDSFDLRAVLSIWMKWYLNAFIPPVLLADLLLMQTLPVALDRVAFIVGDDSRIAAVRIDGAGVVTDSADPFSRFDELIFGHFAPLIDILDKRSGVTQRVLWSNVGNTFEAMLCRVESVSGPSERTREARRLLAEPSWPDGRPNPIYDAVRYVDTGDRPTRCRRICCLQYLLPDRRFCKACPIDEARRPAENTIIS